MAAHDLITAMISNNHVFRPNALEVLYHCLFWPPDKQLAFFQVRKTVIRNMIIMKQENIVLITCVITKTL